MLPVRLAELTESHFTTQQSKSKLRLKKNLAMGQLKPQSLSYSSTHFTLSNLLT